MQQTESQRRRGRPRGTGYDEHHLIAEVERMMDEHGVSRRRAIAMVVDSHPSNIRRLEKKMTEMTRAIQEAQGEHDEGFEAHVAQVAPLILDLIARHILHPAEMQVYVVMRDHGYEAVPLNTVEESSTAMDTCSALATFFRVQRADSVSQFRSFVLDGEQHLLHPEWADLRDFEIKCWLTHAYLHQAKLEGRADDLNEDNFLARINDSLKRNLLREMEERNGKIATSSHHYADLSAVEPKDGKILDQYHDRRRALRNQLMDLASEYAKLAGNDWHGDTLLIEDLTSFFVSELGIEDGTGHLFAAATAAVRRRIADRDDPPEPFRFEVSFSPARTVMRTSEPLELPGASPAPPALKVA